MIKLGAVMAAIAISDASAQAQPSYSEIVDTQRFCEQTGELWREVKESDTIMGKPLKKWSAEHQAGKYTQSQFDHFMMIFIYAKSERFRNGNDAYMAGWAKCMDESKERKERSERRSARQAREAAAAASTPSQ